MRNLDSNFTGAMLAIPTILASRKTMPPFVRTLPKEATNARAHRRTSRGRTAKKAGVYVLQAGKLIALRQSRI